MITCPLPAESQLLSLAGDRCWTPLHEVKFLCWLAQQATGDIIEIGCNQGQTTLELALTCPGKRVWAVDYTGSDDSMCSHQKHEKPAPGTVGIRAKHLPNVHILEQKSATIDYAIMHPIGLVFIDGDHSYQGVQSDSDLALRYFLQTRNSGAHGIPLQRYVVWHDVCESHPPWVEVLKYLMELDRIHPVTRLEGTWLAYLQI